MESPTSHDDVLKRSEHQSRARRDVEGAQDRGSHSVMGRGVVANNEDGEQVSLGALVTRR